MITVFQVFSALYNLKVTLMLKSALKKIIMISSITSSSDNCSLQNGSYREVIDQTRGRVFPPISKHREVG